MGKQKTIRKKLHYLDFKLLSVIYNSTNRNGKIGVHRNINGNNIKNKKIIKIFFFMQPFPYFNRFIYEGTFMEKKGAFYETVSR